MRVRGLPATFAHAAHSYRAMSFVVGSASLSSTSHSQATCSLLLHKQCYTNTNTCT